MSITETTPMGTPERLRANPRENADDAYAAMMSMSPAQWDLFYGSPGVPHGLTRPEQEGYARACLARHVPLLPEGVINCALVPAAEVVAIQPETVTTSDGWVIDAETGEVLTHVDRPFEVVDRNGAEWVLEKLMDADALILAEEAKLAAIAECIKQRIKVQSRRRDWLRARFGPELERYAAGQLAGQKARTLVLDHGKISFRKTAGSITVEHMAEALDWARANAPEAIKVTETVLVTPLKGRDDLPQDIFTITAPGEKCTVETGIK